jgi:hypothetical protein
MKKTIYFLLAALIAISACSDHNSLEHRMGAGNGTFTVPGILIVEDTIWVNPSAGVISTPPYIDAYNGNPNGIVTAPKGSFVIDYTTPALWQNASGGSAWNAVGGPEAEPDYGPGIDGAPNFDGTSTVTLPNGTSIVPTSGVYDLPRHLYTSGATVGSSAEVKLNGFAWFDNGSGVDYGKIDDDGYGTSGRSAGWYAGTNGEEVSSTNILGAPFGASCAGGAGGVASPSPPGSTPGGTGANGSSFCGGGGGGADGAGDQGGSATASAVNSTGPFYDTMKRGATGVTFSAELTAGAGGGCGSVGACGGSHCSFGVGAGGTGGGFAVVLWQSINGTGTVSANGGSGSAGCSCSNPSANASGGGGGGAGGYCYLQVGHRYAAISCAANGGSGGAGGAGGCVPGGPGGNGGSGYAKTLSQDGS